MNNAERLMKVGNLTIYLERGSGFLNDLFFDGPTITLYAYNGADCVKQETYLQVMDETSAVNRFMELMDYYTLPQIHRAFGIARRPIASEYNGKLLSGQLASGDPVDYFKRVDDTRFFKHFTHRPMMA